MDEKIPLTPNDSDVPQGQKPNAIDVDSFFSSFDFLDDLEEKPAEAPKAAEASPALDSTPTESPADSPASPAPATVAPAAETPVMQPESPFVGEVPPVESLDFLDDAKKDIGDILADYAAEPEKPAEDGFDFQINIPQKPVGNDSFSPSVSFIPDDTADREISRLYQEIAAEKGETLPPLKPLEKGRKPEAEAVPLPPAEGSNTAKETKAEKKKKEKKKKSSSDTVRRIVLTFAIIVIIASLGVLAKTYFLDPYLADKQSQDAADKLIGVGATLNSTQEAEKWRELKAKYPNVTFAPDMLIKYAELYAANQDMAGWITINNTGIDLPLVQGTDNDYYLRRNLYKKYTEYGVPFFDYRNDLYFLNRNTVVYGHNMRYSDKIFGMLENYKTVDGFKKAPLIQCNTIYEDYTWKVYAVFITNSEPADDNGYVFPYNFIQLDDATFTQYIEQVNKRALYTTGVDINASDNILTLSTCCYDFDSAKIVVVARLLRDGESTQVDTSLAKANPNPKYPQAWYTAKNKTNPYEGDAKWYIPAN